MSSHNPMQCPCGTPITFPVAIHTSFLGRKPCWQNKRRQIQFLMKVGAGAIALMMRSQEFKPFIWAGAVRRTRLHRHTKEGHIFSNYSYTQTFAIKNSDKAYRQEAANFMTVSFYLHQPKYHNFANSISGVSTCCQHALHWSLRPNGDMIIAKNLLLNVMHGTLVLHCYILLQGNTAERQSHHHNARSGSPSMTKSAVWLDPPMIWEGPCQNIQAPSTSHPGTQLKQKRSR